MTLQLRIHIHHSSFEASEMGATGTVDKDGLKRTYKAGPKNGITENGRSQNPSSSL